jgi:DNA-binding beta-propeller fold protein YncE
MTADGKTIVVANYENDSISLVSTAANDKTTELDLRPGKNDPSKAGVAGREFPYWVTVKGNDVAYVPSVRDREVVVIDLQPRPPRILTRIPAIGNPPDGARQGANMALRRARQQRCDRGDRHPSQPGDPYSENGGTGGLLASVVLGASPNSLTLSADELTLYVTNGGTNSVAVLSVLTDGGLRVDGLIPTGWYPNSVSVSADGKMLYVVNSKSNTGPNPAHCRSIARAERNFA